ncbi:hypothetical protein HWI79_1176 [Cryptosporidium felis]|nr:hypothetical protein HWI79_1176 [Cryptosporidium felis]
MPSTVWEKSLFVVTGILGVASGLRNNIFGGGGMINPQSLLPGGQPPGMQEFIQSAQNLVSGISGGTPAIPETTTTTTTTAVPTPTPQSNTGLGSVVSQVFKKASLEEINKDIKEVIQNEASSSGFGLCIFTSNPYIEFGFRDTNYEKCTKILLSMDTWLDNKTVNNLMTELMGKVNLSIPSLRKLKIPSLEVLFKETFLQVCVNFFVSLVNSGSLFLNGNPCTGTKCHDQLNSVCSTLSEKYGKSASVLGSSVITETVKKICQESRRQLAAKHPSLIASPADIRSDNKPVEVIEPIPT